MGKEYNGHKDWDHWNVSLWLNNDEEVYRMMCRFARFPDGAYKMLQWLGEGSKTPDGARYTLGRIKAAMQDL